MVNVDLTIHTDEPTLGFTTENVWLMSVALKSITKAFKEFFDKKMQNYQ